ncbi:uncharacterized protein [Ptychodera flava]|uniref:uncharacterized protein n=1 Tax=Ptychodera flava TaxID=63121 RepID=UPI00396A1B96
MLTNALSLSQPCAVPAIVRTTTRGTTNMAEKTSTDPADPARPKSNENVERLKQTAAEVGTGVRRVEVRQRQVILNPEVEADIKKAEEEFHKRDDPKPVSK